MLSRPVALFVTPITGVLMVGAPVSAAFTPGDFPTTSDVRDAIGRGGTWDRYVHKNYPDGDYVLGARPAQCASDRPFSDAVSSRSAYFTKQRLTARQVNYNASVTLYQFKSRAKARAAFAKVRVHVQSCPKYTQWYCTQCDGIDDVWQQPAQIPNVGDATYAWAGRSMSNFGERYRTAVVLDYKDIVQVKVAIMAKGISSPFPASRPSKPELRRWADIAYASAP